MFTAAKLQSFHKITQNNLRLFRFIKFYKQIFLEIVLKKASQTKV